MVASWAGHGKLPTQIPLDVLDNGSQSVYKKPMNSQTAKHYHDSQNCHWCQSGNHSHSPMDEYPDAHVYLSEKQVPWVQLCKRTEDPKLVWLEQTLKMRGIPSRRHGHSFHGPILEVRQWDEDKAWEILTPVDDIEDDDPQWRIE